MALIFAEHDFDAARLLTPAADYRPFGGREALLPAIEAAGRRYIPAAEKQLGQPWPSMDATLYMEFSRNGNRSRFEDVYFGRRSRLAGALFAELAEKKGRFTDEIINGIWHILEESTWVLPAHNWLYGGLPERFCTLDGDGETLVDLFSAATAGLLSWVWYLTDGLLDEVPVVRRRLRQSVYQRVLIPCYEREDNGWMGYQGQQLNNWTPWIVSNMLTAAAILEDDDAKRAHVAGKAMAILDRFTRPYPDDGGCDEGPGYWNVAGASYFDCLQLLHDMSGGGIDVYGEDLPRRMADYIMNFRVTDGVWINFADASFQYTPDCRLLSRMADAFRDARLADFAGSCSDPERPAHFDVSTSTRGILNMLTPQPVGSKADFTPEERLFYPDLGVAVTQEKDGFFLALKGGHNGESHNHNDVGQILLYRGGRPVFLDAGVDQYTAKTFSRERYTLWAMRADYHNIPRIGGVEQRSGRQYRAEITAYDAATGACSMELKNAWPQEAGVRSYVRTASLVNGVVTVTDALSLQNPETVAFHYVTADKPDVRGNTIVFACGAVAEFDPRLTPSLNEIPVEGTRIGNNWKRASLWRITLRAEAVRDDAFTLTVR